jgi:hypothetical protein
MMEPGWQQNSLASQRTWLGEAQPDRFEEGLPGYVWGTDCDAAIDALPQRDADVDALFVVAEAGGLAIIPVWPGSVGVLHPLMELASTTDDTDWILVSRLHTDGDFAGDMILESPPSAYAPLHHHEQHQTPRWSIRISQHS